MASASTKFRPVTSMLLEKCPVLSGFVVDSWPIEIQVPEKWNKAKGNKERCQVIKIREGSLGSCVVDVSCSGGDLSSMAQKIEEEIQVEVFCWGLRGERRT